MYESNKKALYVPNYRRRANRQKITFKEFVTVIRCYFDIKFEWLLKYGTDIDIHVPLINSSFCLRKIWQERSFHVFSDRTQTDKKGNWVKSKIPILDDWYSVIMLRMPYRPNVQFRTKFSRNYNDLKNKLVKKIGYDPIKVYDQKTKK